MRILFASLMLTAVTGSALAAGVKATSRVDSVIVFPSGAEVTRIAKVKIDKGEHAVTLADLPASAIASSIRVDGKATGKLEIGSVDTRRLSVPESDAAAADAERKRIEDTIDRVQDELATLKGQVEAATKQRQLIANLTKLPTRPVPAGSIAPPQDWAQILGLISSATGQAISADVAAKARVRETERKLSELQRRLAELAPKQLERTEVRVLVSAAAPLEADLAIRYQVPNASWQAGYDARLTTGAKNVTPKLELVRRASIQQRSGEAWDEVALQLSTTRPSAGTAAPKLAVMTVDFESELRPAPMAAPATRSEGAMQDAEEVAPQRMMKRKAARAAMAAPEPVSEVSASVEAAPFQAVFTVPGRVSVAGTGEAKRVQLQSDAVEPTLSVRTTPKVDAKAFLYAKLIGPKGAPLLPGKVALFRDGTFAGTGQLPLLSPGEEHDLGFGTDDAVRVKFAVVEDKRGETGLISSSRTESRNFKVTVKNLHERAIQVTVLDQVPVSQNQEIKVEPVGRSVPSRKDIEDQRGVVAFDQKMEPDEERVLEFGYRVTWPGAKSIIYGAR